jgi:hypothetical protein
VTRGLAKQAIMAILIEKISISPDLNFDRAGAQVKTAQISLQSN